MQGDYYKPGDWNAICDICGFRFKASQLRKNWKNEMVCEDDFELRHPQEFIRVRPEHIGVPWARPEGEDVYLQVCWIWSSSGYVGLAEVGCAKVGSAPLSYVELYSMKWPTPPELVYDYAYSGIPGYAIPGKALPGNPTFIEP